MKTLRSIFSNKYVLAALFIAAFFIVRIPFYSMPLQGEDGIFTDLFFSNPPNPDYVLFARIAGKPIYRMPEHPAPLYETIRITGKIFKVLVPNWQSFSEHKLTFMLRLTFSLFQFIVLLGMIAVILSRERGKNIAFATFVPVLFVTMIALPPFAVRSSISIQVDGTSGVLASGLVSIVVLLYQYRRISFPAFIVLVLASAFLTGLGKNEWSIILLTAIIVCFLYCLFLRLFKVEAPIGKYCIVLAAFLLGNLAGNFTSYLYDAVNYVGGFNVMGRIVKATGYAKTVGVKGDLYLPVLLLAFLIAALPDRIRKGDLWAVLLGVYGFGLFSSFLLSKWAADVRYFAPSLVPLLSACVIAVPFDRGAAWRRAVIAATVCIALVSTVCVIRQVEDRETVDRKYAEIQSVIMQRRGSGGECVPLLECAAAYRAGIDFVGSSMGLEGAQSLAARFGKNVCTQ